MPRAHRVAVRRRVAAPPEEVWRHLRDIASHTTWMADAVAIRFDSPQREGVGTSFECDTRVGPVALVDHMVVTEWEDGRSMGVRHTGVVTGSGRFTLEADGGATLVTWDESLRFPWWLRPVGRVAARALHLVWTGNLRRLARRVEAG